MHPERQLLGRSLVAQWLHLHYRRHSLSRQWHPRPRRPWVSYPITIFNSNTIFNPITFFNSNTILNPITFFNIDCAHGDGFGWKSDDYNLRPSTVAEYSTLTTATTASTTTTDSSGAIIIIPLIIGPGGVIWVPNGGVPLPPGATPPSTPPGSDSDPEQPSENPDVTTTDGPTTTDDPTPTSSSPSSSSSVAPVPTVTLVGDPPLPDYQQIMGIEPFGPLPADPPDTKSESSPDTTSASSDAPTAPRPTAPTLVTPFPTPTPSNATQTPGDPHVGTPECFPSHGTTDEDRIISIVMTDERISTFCAGTEPSWTQVGADSGGNGDPKNNNRYDATFTMDANAPELCKLLYTEKGKSQPDVQNACTNPFKAIREACPFNGGQVKADCGLWTLQSCPSGGSCKTGEPGQHCQMNPGSAVCL